MNVESGEEIHVHKQVNYSFQYTDLYKTHRHATNFRGHLRHQILAKSDKKCIKHGQNLIYDCK